MYKHCPRCSSVEEHVSLLATDTNTHTSNFFCVSCGVISARARVNDLIQKLYLLSYLAGITAAVLCVVSFLSMLRAHHVTSALFYLVSGFILCMMCIILHGTIGEYARILRRNLGRCSRFKREIACV